MYLTTFIEQFNLISSLILAFLFLYQLREISKRRVDGKYQKAQWALILLFVMMVIKGVLQFIIYSIALGDPAHVVLALYLENIKNFIVNLGFVTTGLLLEWIIKEK